MPSPISFSVSSGTLPPNFSGTPQDFLNQIAQLIAVTPAEDWNSFLVGNSLPTSDVGPVLLGGQNWHVWDVGLGQYIPLPLQSESLQYIISQTAPDPAKYLIWVRVDGANVPEAILTHDGAQWADVYAAKFPVPVEPPKFSTILTASQPVGSNAPAKLLFGGVVYDTSASFAPAQFRFIAPEDGFYSFNGSARFDNTASSTPTGMSISLWFAVNSVEARTVEYTLGTSTLGTTVPLTAQLQLTAGDFVELYTQVDVVSGTASWTVTNDPRKTVFEGRKL